MNEAPEKPKDPIKAAFTQFCDAWFLGDRQDTEAFCKNHPECGPELQEKIENFLFVEQGLSDAGRTDEKTPIASTWFLHSVLPGCDVVGRRRYNFRWEPAGRNG